MRKKKGRNRNGSGSIHYCEDRPAKPWRIRYTIHDPVSLRSQRKDEYFADPEDAKKALFDRTHAIADGSYKDRDKQTLSTWLNDYLKEFSTVQESTRMTYDVFMRKHILPAIGNLRLCDLNREILQRFTNSLYKDLAPSSVRIVAAFISAALNQAKLFGYIPENYANNLQYQETEKKELPALTDEEALALEAAAVNSPVGDMIFIALRTGLRKSEVLGLQWQHVDLDEGRAQIFQLTRDMPGQERSIKKPKNKDARIIVLCNTVIERLRMIQKKQRAARLKAGSGWSNDLNLVFTNEIGQPITQGSVDYFFRRVRKAAGLPKEITFHSLRRTFVTRAERAGLGDKALISQVGHSTVDFTRSKYSRFNADMQKETREQLNRIFAS